MDSTDNSPEPKDGDTYHRKNTLETLTKDDLVKKCKNLLSIAQKAKQAKDEASDEVKRLKETLNNLQGRYEKAKGDRTTKESPCQAEINAMQEMVATLTEQKLRLTMEMDAMLKHSDTIEKQLETAKLEERKTRQALAAASARADEQEVAAESGRRQIARLLQENDDLLQRLDKAELDVRAACKITSVKDDDIKNLQSKITSMEGELLVLQEELDGVSEESRRKYCEMKKVNEQLSIDRETLEEERDSLSNQLREAHESLDSAAHENDELEKRLRAVTEAAERDKQTLTERLAQLAVDMKRLEECSSNAENLKDLMKILHAEKDQYFQEKEKLKHQTEILNEQLKIMTQENEAVSKEVETLKKNNIELQELVQNIESSNDNLLKDASRMETEKQKLSDVLGPICKERDSLAIDNKQLMADRVKMLERLESAIRKKDIILQEHNILKSENRKLTECLEFVSKEKHILAEENNQLKAEKQKLNEYLEAIVIEKTQMYEEKEKLSAMIETINTEKNVIFNENVGLKDEKEKLNQDLRAASVEADALRAEVRDAERRVRSAVRRTLTVLQQFLGSTPPEISGEPLIENFPAVMSALEENLDKISSLSSKTSNGSSNNTVESAIDIKRRESHTSDSASELPPPPAELAVGSEAQTNEEFLKLHSEVEQLRGIAANLEKHCEKLRTENERLRKALRPEDAGSNYSVKFSDPQIQEELRDELDCARKQLVEKTREMQLLRDEMSHVLQHQSAPRLSTVTQGDDLVLLRTELAARSAELDALKSEFAKAKDMLKELTKVEDKEKEIQMLMQEIAASKEKQSSYEALVQKFKQEVTSLQGKVNKFQASVTKKNSEIESLKEELKVLRDNEASFQSGMEIFHEEEMKLKEEVISLQEELAERTTSLESMSSEVESLKEQCKKFSEEKVCLQNESQNLKDEISKSKEDLQSRTITLEDKCKEYNDLEKSNNLTKEELNEKIELLSMKEKECEEINSDASMLREEVTEKSSKLEEKMQELESLNQKYKVLEQKLEDGSGKTQENIFKLQDRSVKLKKALDEKIAENERLHGEAQQLLEQNEKVLKELTVQEEEMVNLKKQLAVKSAEVDGLIDELRKMEAENKETSDNLSKVIEAKAAEVDNLQKQLEQMKINEEGMGSQMIDLEVKVKEVAVLNSELEDLKTTNTQLSGDLKKQQETIAELMRVVEEKTVEVTHLREEVKVAEERFNDKQRALESLTDELANVQNSSAEALGRLATATKELGEARERLAASERAAGDIEEMQKNLQDLKAAKELLNDKLQSLCFGIGKMSSLMNDLRSSRQQLLNDIQVFKEQSHTKMSSSQIALKATIERLVQTESSRSQELLTEMNEMNQVLKQRGEVISKLQEAGRDLEARLRTTEDKLTTTCEELQTRERRLLEAEEEVSSLKSRLQTTEAGEGQSEVMSTSTISKTEETSRLKDVEESFEDRYTKLRTVAVRLKKRVAELQNQFTACDAERRQLLAERSDLTAHLSQASSHAKNLQTVQLECDRLQDALDQQSKEMKSQQKSLETAKTEIVALQSQVTELTVQREKIEQALEIAKRDCSSLENGLATARKERDSEKSISSRLRSEVNHLQEEMKKTENRLEEEVEKHKAMQGLLDASRQESKKRSVLSLEMEDYERSVADLQQQLLSERKRLTELEGHLNVQKDITSGLQEQLRLVEDRAQTEEKRCKDIKAHLTESRAALAHVQQTLQAREDQLASEKSHTEKLQAEAEAHEVQYALLVGEKERAGDAARTLQEALTAQVRALEDRCAHLLGEVADRDQQLSHIKSEFEGYKVRAQAVLRQKATNSASSPTAEEDALEECTRLRRQCEALRLKLEETSTRLEAANIELAAAQEERDSAVRKCEELSETARMFQQKEASLSEQHHEAVRSAKLQMEMLHSCYKNQLEDTENRLQNEIKSLTEELKRSRDELKQKSVCRSPAVVLTGQALSPSHQGSAFVPVKPPEPLDVGLLEREEGEGSEYVEEIASPRITASRELMPLDKLLAASPEDENLTVTTITASNVDEPVKRHLGRNSIGSSDESHVRHLASLLGEAEQDLARLTQLNSVLKEEVRRLTRSLERQEHAGNNLEYLKNVILKFVTLQGGDERSRLVPVLNTLLTLSPEEVGQLNQVARGAGEGGGRGWGTYLHLWPSAP